MKRTKCDGHAGRARNGPDARRPRAQRCEMRGCRARRPSAARQALDKKPGRREVARIPIATPSTSRCWPIRKTVNAFALPGGQVFITACVVSRSGNRRPIGRRAGPRGRPRHRATQQQADGQGANVPGPGGGRRRRRRRREQRPHGPGHHSNGQHEIRPRRRAGGRQMGRAIWRPSPATIRGR